MVRESESKATAGVEQGSGDTACFVYDKSTCLSGMIWNCYLLSVCPVGFAIRRLILLFCRSRLSSVHFNVPRYRPGLRMSTG